MNFSDAISAISASNIVKTKIWLLNASLVECEVEYATNPQILALASLLKICIKKHKFIFVLNARANPGSSKWSATFQLDDSLKKMLYR